MVLFTADKNNIIKQNKKRESFIVYTERGIKKLITLNLQKGDKAAEKLNQNISKKAIITSF